MELIRLALLVAFIPVAAPAALPRVTLSRKVGSDVVTAPAAVGSSLALPSTLIGAPPIVSGSLDKTAPTPSDKVVVPTPSAHNAIGHETEPGAYVSRLLAETFSKLDGDVRLPEGSATGEIRRRVRRDLMNTALEAKDRSEADTLSQVAVEIDKALPVIQARLDSGEIDPQLSVRVDPDAPAVKAPPRPVKIGFYPIAADPFQWGHLIIALRAMGEVGLDQIVFVLQGDDPIRKPTMTPAEIRHPMGQEVINLFAPFFRYSPIARGTSFDGETNIFRFMALNSGVPIEGWYMVGDDHYRLVDKNGNPDTLPKLETNSQKDFGQDSSMHQIRVAFIERESPNHKIPTSLTVRFLSHVGFDVSSSMARGGRHDLVPYTALRYARTHGLYGLNPN